MPETSVLRQSDVEALNVGLAFLGSGGGGDAGLMIRDLRRLLASRELPLLYPDEAIGQTVVPVGIVGATSVFGEKLPAGTEFSGAVDAVAKWTGSSPTVIMGMEGGGLNGVTALHVALSLRMPFLDADLMGRALPRLDQLTWAASGLSITPCALQVPSGQTVIVDCVDPVGLERTVRAFLLNAGGWAAIALRPTDAKVATDHSVVGSIARALALGRAHSTLGSAPSPDVVEERLGGHVLATGRIVEVARHRTPGAFGKGSVTVIDQVDGTLVKLEAENEFLLALADGIPVATCPDLLCLLDRRSALPLRADSLRVGAEVMAVALPGPAWWRKREVLPRVSPAAFGYETAPVLLGDEQ